MSTYAMQVLVFAASLHQSLQVLGCHAQESLLDCKKTKFVNYKQI